jgi:hypothetical protein
MLRLFLSEESCCDNCNHDIIPSEDIWDHQDDERPSIIFLPPITVLNLGEPDENDLCVLEAVENPSTPHAGHVILRPFGRVPVWPRFETPTTTATALSGETTEKEDPFWIYPSVNTLVGKSHLLSVYDSKCDRMCFYMVMDVVHADDDAAKDLVPYFLITKSTTFQLDDSPLQSDYEIPRFPCLLSQKHYIKSNDKEFNVPPHPDIPTLALALDLPASSLSNERILHVVGTDRDHDLSFAIETASHRVGRTCWTLRGLAAYAHSVGQKVRTGSLADQLAGLDAAFDEIHHQRMQPCVLHLHCIDTDLSVNDDSVRREQESRLWATIQQALSPRTPVYFDSAPSDSSHRSTCPLIVVLSSSKPLKPGPWLENMVFPSIRLSLPNPAYARYLWQESLWDDAIETTLSGRGSSEIRKIHEGIKVIDDATEARNATLEVCRSHDDQRRKERSAAVAQVRWEDVGGLAHVRDEIMDAIELPLKHPHLFSGGKGRTGILLYGT